MVYSAAEAGPIDRPNVVIDPANARKLAPFLSKCRSVVIDDSDTTSDLKDLEGPGGPNGFDLDMNKLISGANKVIVAVGGSSELVQGLMNMAARPEGYFVVVDTPVWKFRAWVDKCLENREGHQGLILFGPRRLLSGDLVDRCVADSESMPVRGLSTF